MPLTPRLLAEMYLPARMLRALWAAQCFWVGGPRSHWQGHRFSPCLSRQQ
jgi:hypothetical protein